MEPVGRDSRRDLVRFWKAGNAPHEGSPDYVVPLLDDCIHRWSPRSALFAHARTQHFVAVRGGRDVGRVAATVDDLHDRVHGAEPGERTGFFGWFDAPDDPAVAHALLDAAAAWLRAPE